MLGDESDPDSAIAEQVRFWSEALAGAPDELPLPVDRPRPPVASHDGGMLSFGIGPELHAGLASLAQATGTTGVNMAEAA